jgi:uncharacterized RDD family membrane protein YckC
MIATTEINSQLDGVLASLVISCLVWLYYRRKPFAEALRYATFGPRFWSGSVDSCVLWPVTFIATVLLSLGVSRLLAVALVSVQSLAWGLYTVIMHGRYGQTVGKMVTKVRVVDFRTEQSISWRQAWLREAIPMVVSLGLLGFEASLILTGRLTSSEIARGEDLATHKQFWFLVAIPGLWFLAEILTMLANEKRRALHDLIAGTVVVRTHSGAKRRR